MKADLRYDISGLHKNQDVSEVFPDLKDLYSKFKFSQFSVPKSDPWIRLVILMTDPGSSIARNNEELEVKLEQAGKVAGIPLEVILTPENLKAYWEMVTIYFMHINAPKWEAYYSIRMRTKMINRSLRESAAVDFADHKAAMAVAKEVKDFDPILEEMRLQLFGTAEELERHIIKYSDSISGNPAEKFARTRTPEAVADNEDRH